MKEINIEGRTYFTHRENIKRHYRTFIFYDKKLLSPMGFANWSSIKETNFLNIEKLIKTPSISRKRIPKYTKIMSGKYRTEKIIDKDGQEFFLTYNSQKSRIRQLEILINSDEYSSANAEDIGDFISIGEPTEHEYAIMDLVALKSKYGK